MYNYYPDIRVVRTRKALREALIDLLQDAPYELVQVTEIAQKALINRVTFYNHYASKDELMEEILDLALDNYSALTQQFNPASDSYDAPAKVEKYIRINFEHYEKHAKLYRILLSDSFPSYREKFIGIMQDSIRQVLSNSQNKSNLDDADFAFFTEWYVGGTIQTVLSYINNPNRPTAEEIAQRTMRLNSPTLY